MVLLSTILWGISFLVSLFVLYAYFGYRSHSKYFKKHEVPYIGAGLIRLLRLLVGQATLVDVEIELYEDSVKRGPIVGFSDVFASKGLYVTDLETIRNIYVRDFEHFVNRRPVQTQTSNLYFKKMLFAMESNHWKLLRTKLSPSFTTGKIKRMFEIFASSSVRMSDYVKEQVGTQGDFDFALAFPKYAMDVIASCAFGIDSRCFDVPPTSMSTFEDMGKRFQFNLKAGAFLKFLVMTLAPKVADAFGLEVFDVAPQNYFSQVIKGVIKDRRQTGERREDFLQLMLDAQQGLLKIDDDTNEVLNGTTEKNVLNNGDLVDKQNLTFDDEGIIANCLLFMLGGFDTTQSLLLFAVYQLALEQEVQEKVYAEVKAKMNAAGGKITYDAALDMNYMDMFLNETLRFFPPAGRTERSCTKDYHVPGTNMIIEKGTIIGIPIYPIHHDSRYFDDPEKFEPERFTPENKAARHPYAFMPFGHGPRNCIGMRFALTEVKAVIAQLVYTFKFSPCEKTLIPMKFDRNTNLKPRGGMTLRVALRNH